MAVDLEPVGSAAVPRTALRHAHGQTLLQPARLARRPILLVDHAPAAARLALGRHRCRGVGMRPAKKRLEKHQNSIKNRSAFIIQSDSFIEEQNDIKKKIYIYILLFLIVMMF